MMSLWKKHKIGVTLSVMMAGWIALIYFGIIPLYQGIYDQLNEGQRLLVDREMKSELRSRLAEIKGEVEKVQRQQKSLDVVVSREQLVSLIEKIESLARDSGVQLTADARQNDVASRASDQKKKTAKSTDSQKQTLPETLWDKLPVDTYVEIDIKVEGDYAHVIRFIHQIETVPEALDIFSVDMKIQEENKAASTSRENVFAMDTVDLQAASSEGATDSSEAVSTSAVIEASLDTVIYVANQ